MRADKAYKEAIQYYGGNNHVGKLRGKYDNVRTFWEDPLTGYFIKPYLDKLITQRQEANKGIRIKELGCGAGEGYDFLTGISLDKSEETLIPNKVLEYYNGVDLNQELLLEANKRFEDKVNVEFFSGDFSEGLPVDQSEQSYDLYFTAYATLSHCNNEELEKLFSDIAKHGENGSILVADWIGRYSYEWQNHWTSNPEQKNFLDYKLNFYSDRAKEVSTFPLRMMSPQEVEKIVQNASEKSNKNLEIVGFLDRSMIIGRHIETGCYNNNPQPIRSMVNSLHEPGHRTYLPNLLFDYEPRPGFEWQNKKLKEVADCWNSLVRYTVQLLDIDNPEKGLPNPPKTSYDCLKRAYNVIRKTVEMSNLLYGDVRANLIEKQLGFSLRNIEINMQKGLGLGHSLIAVIRVNK
ncbi:class I SAM-dependent methyltransferase [Natranaerobius trueperi]|uniref:Methyltransferase domain-containing protein n=1 Tax=Natranaerobius trueperi TaxID=759412 RepID=A0A226BUU8_9FIRM|nr:class I SAM-dependent methyltransferase [Natranaerobius trueperi]OWZ82755.1 hypothetical protein CDO51_12290 [Natranaerobius trueperi]